MCREASPEQLLAQLSVQSLDVVLADAPIAPGVKVRAYNHLLGETGVSFLGDATLARTYCRRFPKSLHSAPVLLPATNTAIRRSIDHWLDTVAVRPNILGEFDDSELLWESGAAGGGIFPVPTVLERHLTRLHRVKVVGRTDAVRGRFYAISVEHRLKHPVVVAICETVRRELFAGRRLRSAHLRQELIPADGPHGRRAAVARLLVESWSSRHHASSWSEALGARVTLVIRSATEVTDAHRSEAHDEAGR